MTNKQIEAERVLREILSMHDDGMIHDSFGPHNSPCASEEFEAVIAEARVALAANEHAASQPAGDAVDCRKCFGSSVRGEVRGVRCTNCEGRGYIITPAAPVASAPAQPELIAMIVDRDTPPDNRNRVVDHDITGKPITQGDVDAWARHAPATPAQAEPSAMPDAATVDEHLDEVLCASGSALKYFSMPKTLEAMRTAMRKALCRAQVSDADKVDAARLDFVLERQAFILTIPAGQSINAKECYQLMEQDEDEDFHAISGENIAYGSKRDAIDAAIAAIQAQAGEGEKA